MANLKELLPKLKKEQLYAFYKKVLAKPKKYTQITKMAIYNSIISIYQEDPEIISSLCSSEEIGILNKLIDGNIPKLNQGFIEFCLFLNLERNFLIIANESTYSIPDDLLNYIKMALNLYEEKKHSFIDVTNNTIIGLTRIHATMPLSQFLQTLEKYKQYYSPETIKKIIKSNPYLNDKVDIIKYQNESYVISLEYHNARELIPLTDYSLEPPEYSLEEVISIGKYHLNLFKEPILQFLNFLELHLKPESIYSIVIKVIFYSGLGLENSELIKNISGNIEELYQSILKVIPYFPVWIYNGRELHNLKFDEQ